MNGESPLVDTSVLIDVTSKASIVEKARYWINSWNGASSGDCRHCIVRVLAKVDRAERVCLSLKLT
jgi:hypothetical protein